MDLYKLDPENYQPIDLTTPKLPMKRSSFFNLVQTNEENEVEMKPLNKEKYIENLTKEKADWTELLMKSRERAKKFSEKQKEQTAPDFSALSKDRQEYLKSGINIEQYLKEYEEFARSFVFHAKEKEWLQMRLSYAHEQLQDRINEKTIKNLSLDD